MRRSVLLFGALVLVVQLALALAVFDPSPHTGGDNAGYLTLAYSLLDRGAYLDLQDPDEPIHTKYPPVYPAVLAVAALVGARSWTAFKSLSALFMAGAVVLTFFWVERRRGLAPALTIAAVLALSEAFLFHTHWILSDPLFLFLTVASLWCFTLADEASPEGNAVDPGEGYRKAWLTMACGAAILAFFTRSAGLPLIVSIAAALAVRGWWRPLVLFGLAFAAPALAWWVRSRGGESYALEFWLIDPYRPDLGRAGLADLVLRVTENLRAYVGRWLPGGLIGLRGGLVSGVGVVMVTLAGMGWWRRARKRPGLAEFFAPMYLGLILLWPVVWAGDRFALPLYGFLLFYAAETVLRITERLTPWLRTVTAAVTALPFLIPATLLWSVTAAEATECRALVAAEGAFACYGASVREYVKAAEWSTDHLPATGRVLTRKPRLFYVMAGLKGRTLPLTRDPGRFLEVADEGGMDYAMVDYLDGLAAYYLVPVIQNRPEAFCSLVGFGPETDSRTEIFGIVGAEGSFEAGEVRVEDDAAVVSLQVCPGSPPDGSGPVRPPYGGPLVPLFSTLD